MQYLLSSASRSVLKRLADEQTLCAFDFDGTLSRIVVRPEKARMRDRTRSLLGQLASRYPCVIISGRARSDVLQKLNGIHVARVIGNHGAETERTRRKSRRNIQQWKRVLENDLPAIPGLWIEDKGLSLTVHYRQCSQRGRARLRVFKVPRGLRGVRAFGGKYVVNLVEKNAPHKGDVLATERKRLGCNWVLYVGDDDNDEDAFGLTGNIVPVRIGRKRTSHARYYLRTQMEIEKLLELLSRMRPTMN